MAGRWQISCVVRSCTYEVKVGVAITLYEEYIDEDSETADEAYLGGHEFAREMVHEMQVVDTVVEVEEAPGVEANGAPDES